MHDGEEERKKEKMNKIEIFVFGFSQLIKVNRINRVDLALE